MRYLLLLGLLLFGCSSPKPKEIDRLKSCDGVQYQLDLINQRLEQDRAAVEEMQKRAEWLHIFVISLGVAISVHPEFAASDHFYIAPALTIGYYNLFGASPDLISEYGYLEKRAIALKQIIEEKNCKN